MLRIIALSFLTIALFSGCQQPRAAQRQPTVDLSRFQLFGPNGLFAKKPQTTPIQTQTAEQFKQFSNMAGEILNRDNLLRAFDTDNQQLHTEIAGLKQKLQVANDYNQMLKTQLAGTAEQIKQFQQQTHSAQQELAGARLQVQQLQSQSATQNQAVVGQLVSSPTGSAANAVGTATLRANNSLLNKLQQIQIPGHPARMDGDVVRIEIPSDQLFVPGTYQIQTPQLQLMQNLVNVIRDHFGRNIIGVEAHWDGTPLNPPTTTHHQLTATQSLAVFDQLVRLGLPAEQLFTMALGSNRPRHSTRLPGNPNRRIEIVIYPESYDGI